MVTSSSCFWLFLIALSRSGVTLRMLLEWARAEILNHKQSIDDLSKLCVVLPRFNQGKLLLWSFVGIFLFPLNTCDEEEDCASVVADALFVFCIVVVFIFVCVCWKLALIASV